LRKNIQYQISSLRKGDANMKIEKDCRYTETHEWVRVEGDLATAGITDYAQSQLSDVVYVELPEVGDEFDQGDVFATVESVKAAADVYMPLSGEITEVNEELSGSPELVNEDAFGEGWFIQFIPSDLSELDDLLSPEEYQEHVAKEEEEGGH
jgi:glycine cleavage system H protein